MSETSETAPDWEAVKRHLEKCERAYAAIGTAGYFALTHVIRPVRDRYNRGERSAALAAEILEIAL